MRVVLVASTQLHLYNIDHHTPYELHGFGPDGKHPADADELAEITGRHCYKSEHRPNPATATNETYLDHILEVEHYSILEHASATFFITDVSRSFLAEVTRHRFLSPSVLSQRYVDQGEVGLVIPQEIQRGFPQLKAKLVAHDGASYELYQEAYDILKDAGVNRKAARGAARAFLPEATETQLYLTGNHRAWRDFIWKRTRGNADIEIETVAKELLRQLKELAPNTYQDM